MDKELDGAADKSKSDTQEIPIPEEFQQKVYDLLEGANKQQLNFVRNCCSDCEDEMRKADQPEFSTEGMPA